MATERSWTSASEIADYAFCPRSHWYHEHPPAEGPSSAHLARAAAGTRFHATTLAAERRHAEHGGAYWVGLLVGVVLLVGGIAWIFHP
jgi:CRISPR/Cas system-associated exonuclease Cas4 (RecB family)